jgi:membrane-bound serine protease (ClpP class)
MPVRLLAVLAAVVGCAGGLLAQGGDVGLLVQVPGNLDTNAVKRIEERVNAALARGADRPSTLIFWFTPKDQDTTSGSFGACYELAKDISNWQDVNTVAFVSRKLSGHAVLPALCCNELAMSKEARVGEVVSGEQQLPQVERDLYRSLLSKKPAQFAVVQKMFDKNVRLMKGQKNKADWYYDSLDKAKFEKDGGVAADTKPVADVGLVGLFTSEQMGQFGLRKLAAQNVADLASLLNLNPASLRDERRGGGAAYRYVLRDEITQSVRETVSRSVREVVRNGGDTVFLQLECDGGDAAAARDLAGDLIDFRNPEAGEGIRVIAFVPNNANNTSVIIALGCSEVVLSTRKGMGEGTPEGTFGDFGPYMGKTKQGPEVLGPLLADLADKQNLPANVLRGMVDKDLVLVKVRGVKDRRKTAVMVRSQAQAEKDEWAEEGVLKPQGELLKLTATEARQLGLASVVIDSTNIADVYPKYGIDPAKVKEATPDWLNQFRSILQMMPVTVILVIVGFIGLILELKVPGTTVPGIVAALCFILLFWAWAPVSGQLAWLAGLLFLLGLILILLEVFVLPGFGVAGVIGILLMLASIVLVTLDKIPENGSQWVAVGARMSIYVFALIGAGVASFLIARFLPKVPVANRMVLAPTAEREATDPTILPGAAQAASLLGAIGVASTVLRPAGTVQFGEEFVDVVSDGGFIPAGTRVQVVEVEGTRIVVKEV